MTEQQAIERMRYRIDTATEIAGKGEDGNAFEDMEIAIKALEKQIPKKPFQPFGTHSYKCSNCWKFVAHEVDDNCDLTNLAEWCPYCGQKLDWSEDND